MDRARPSSTSPYSARHRAPAESTRRRLATICHGRAICAPMQIDLRRSVRHDDPVVADLPRLARVGLRGTSCQRLPQASGIERDAGQRLEHGIRDVRARARGCRAASRSVASSSRAAKMNAAPPNGARALQSAPTHGAASARIRRPREIRRPAYRPGDRHLRADRGHLTALPRPPRSAPALGVRQRARLALTAAS